MRTGQPGDRVLDVGCGKGFLLYEFTQVVSGIVATGLDISQYAIQHAKPEVRSYLHIGTALSLPYADHTSDLVLTINTLHNLWLYDLYGACGTSKGLEELPDIS